MKGEMLIKPDITALARWGAEHITSLALEAVQERGVFRAALAGGTTPRALYTQMGSDPYRQRLPWKQIEWYFGDERYVPQNHPDSNYRLVRETLLRNIPSSATRIFPMPTGETNPDDAARRYEQTLQQSFGPGIPVFDLILLGMGVDGHTASLFPKSAALEETARWVVANVSEELPVPRLTMTLPVINAARQIIIFVAGEEKTSTLRKVLEGRTKRFPVQYVEPVNGALVWAVDEGAARELENLSL